MRREHAHFPLMALVSTNVRATPGTSALPFATSATPYRRLFTTSTASKKKKVPDPFGVPHLVPKPVATKPVVKTPAKGFKPSPSTKPVTGTRTVTTPFDYEKWFQDEPTLAAERRRIAEQGLVNRSQLVGGEQQLFGRLGEAPDLSLPQFANLAPELRKALEDAITPELRGIIDQSNQAGTSALARLQYGYKQDQGSTIDRLAGAGILRSSQLGYESNANLRNLTLGQYDVRQQALDALRGLQQSYLSGQSDLAGQTATAVSQAQERAGQLINAGLLGPTSTTVQITNPYLNPAAPKQVSTPVKVGGITSYEPKPTAGNYIPATSTVPKVTAPKAAPYKAPSLGLKALR